MLSIPCAALAEMSPTERGRLLDIALSPSPKRIEAYLLVLAARLRVFERRYEMPSRDLTEAMRSGAIRETREVRLWRSLLRLQGILAEQTGTDQPK
jgi:hypothetical protein